MQLKTLLSATAVRQIIGTLDRTVENIAYDSRRVQRNGMFVALRGEKSDGHEFIGQAIEKGASVIVAEREEQNPRATCLLVENTRTALADFAATFYGYPERKLKLAAVTGTNGKTTTTFLVKHICENAGLRCGLIGTVRYEIGERRVDLNRVGRRSSAQPPATCCLGEETSSSSYSEAKRGAISAQPYRRLSVCARRPRARRSS